MIDEKAYAIAETAFLNATECKIWTFDDLRIAIEAYESARSKETQELLASALETNQSLSKKLMLLKDAGITASKWMYSEIKAKKDRNERNYNPFVKLYDLLYEEKP